MLELELNNATGILGAFKSKPNKKDKLPEAKLAICVAADSDVLAFFGPTLKSMLFDPAAPRDLAEGMPLRDKHMVYPLKRDEEMNGARVVIDYGVAEKIELDPVQLVDFGLTPREGGAVIVEFVVRCRPDAHRHVPYLYLLQGTTITITVVPGAAEDLPTMREAA